MADLCLMYRRLVLLKKFYAYQGEQHFILLTLQFRDSKENSLRLLYTDYYLF